jgi:RNA polymerase sigma-70 factor (ECF subfamily)
MVENANEHRDMPMTLAAVQASLESLSDAELASCIGRGDAKALELVMRRHNRQLYRTARSILRDDADAEDCLQEAYLQAFRSIASFRAASKLSTWLTRVVINQALEKMRRRSKENGNVPLDNVIDLDGNLPAGNSLLSAPEQPDAAALRSEVRRVLESRIDGLPSAFRTVFMLRALEEMSVEETAACLGIPEATVRTRFFRARALLREALELEVDLALEGAFAFDGARCDRIVAHVLDRMSRPPAPESGP